MKSFVAPDKILLESVVLPNYKIKSVISMNGIHSSTTSSDHLSTMENSNSCKDPRKIAHRERINLHLLETTKPNLLLQKIFQSYLILVKILGCQPLKIHSDGCATFSYFSWNVAYVLFVFAMFLLDTIYFLPIMRHMKSEKDESQVEQVILVILVISQVFAALISYVFMALQAKKLACFWNRLQGVLVRLVARCPNHLDLVPSYRSARMKITVWLMFTVVFGTCYMTSFYDEIRSYLNEQNYNFVWYWTVFSGFAGYSVLLSIHILHSTCFTTCICVLVSCFRTLGNIVLKQDAQGTMMNAQSPLLFHEVTEIYEELVDLKCLLGLIYGVHIGLEILAMIICVTSNLFFMISKPEFSSLFVLNFAIVMPYVIWFHGVCKSCGFLNNTMKKCYCKFRKAMAMAVKKIPSEELSHLQVEPPEVLSACGYFLIDMKLFTTVMGTVATYLVVMLQFAFSAGNYSKKENNAPNSATSSPQNVNG